MICELEDGVSADIVVVVRHRFTTFHFVVVNLQVNVVLAGSLAESYGCLVRAYLSGDNHVSISSYIEQKPDER